MIERENKFNVICNWQILIYFFFSVFVPVIREFFKFDYLFLSVPFNILQGTLGTLGEPTDLISVALVLKSNCPRLKLVFLYRNDVSR